MRRFLAPLVALGLLAGCSVNPVTGRSQTFLMAPATEARIGAAQHPRLVAEYGGVYADPALAAYVSAIGRRIALRTGRPDGFGFTVLDSGTVNAFALPGGYIHVTRGLVALAGDEAELASVLAHEIAHVTARHSAERYRQAAIGELGVGLMGAALGGAVASAAGLGADAYLSAYNRQQELEADAIGLSYLARAGYDPAALSRFLRRLDRDHALRQRLTGAADAGGGFRASHPRAARRIVQADILVGPAVGSAGGIRNRDAYLAHIDGLVYGSGIGEGRIVGDAYGNLAAGIMWRAPPGFRMVQHGGTVEAFGPAGSRIVFDRVTLDRPVRADAYLAVWMRESGRPERLTINGFPAATGLLRIDGRAGPKDARLVAIRIGPSTVARFLFLTPAPWTDRLDLDLRRATYSFHALTAADRERFAPARIAIVPVPAGGIGPLIGRMPYATLPAERFAALNGLTPGESPPPGTPVKLIVD
ncbi:M48 family metalloprotease [Inquilinus sp. CAU 1745]|uniref:M48 family metalloprotease n=1 Tax=Inquilinus sp. CAU 1745 TaxID=3140369 RepID=UPI00325BA136